MLQFFQMTILRKTSMVSILTLCVIMAFTRASFPDDDHSVKQDDWNPPSAGPIVTWTAPLCAAGKILIQPFFFYNRTRGIFNDESQYKSFTNKDTKSQYQEVLLAQYSITDKLEIDAQGVFQQNLIRIDGERASSAGFGDSYLYLRYCTIDETKWLPQTTTFFQLKIPTGKYEDPREGGLGTDLMGANTGPGSYEHGYGVIFTKKMKPFIFHADFSYVFPIKTRVEGINVRYGSYVVYDIGVEYFLHKGFNLMLELNSVLQRDSRLNGCLIPNSDYAQMLICPGIGWSDNKIQTLIAYQRTIAGTNAEVKDSFIFTFSYTF